MSRDPAKIMSVFLILLLVSACRATGQSVIAPAGDAAQEDAAPTNTQPPPSAVTSFDCSTVSEISEAECAALVSFYEATEGYLWIENSGWLTTAEPCGWLGVSCMDGHVDMLALFYNGLRGRLPAALANLSKLRVLDLHNNGIGGGIPTEIGGLVTLESLDLSGNKLNGPIPPALGELRALQSASLAHNVLGGPIPDEIGNIAALRNLDLSYNQLDGTIPSSLGDLVALESLRLCSNRLQGNIPFALAASPTLSEIDLSFNALTGPAPSALQLVPVHRLWGNDLEGTIYGAEEGPQTVSYLGATFMFDATTADNVWAELAPAAASADGPGMPWAAPEHIVFTLVRQAGPQTHAPLGLYLPAEAQIHAFPTTTLNEEVQPVVESLKELLSAQPSPAEIEAMGPTTEEAMTDLAMLPPNNARQAFRAQVKYLSFAEGRGVRYLTQLSQGPSPINNQELFYTFQGITDDGSTYIAAYFPVSLAALPDSPQMDEGTFATLLEDWQGYLTETVQLLSKRQTNLFTPDLAALDALVGTISVAGTQEKAQLEGMWPEDGEAVDNHPILQWAAYAGATHYEVVVVDDDAYPPQAVFNAITEATSLEVTPPLEAGSYSWTVWARNTDGIIVAELARQFWIEDD